MGGGDKNVRKLWKKNKHTQKNPHYLQYILCTHFGRGSFTIQDKNPEANKIICTDKNQSMLFGLS